MGREVEEHDIYASEQCVSRCVCVQQKGVKVSDVCGVSQKALGKRIQHFVWCYRDRHHRHVVVCCYLWDKRERLAGRNAQGNCKPSPLPGDKKDKT